MLDRKGDSIFGPKLWVMRNLPGNVVMLWLLVGNISSLLSYHIRLITIKNSYLIRKLNIFDTSRGNRRQRTRLCCRGSCQRHFLYACIYTGSTKTKAPFVIDVKYLSFMYQITLICQLSKLRDVKYLSHTQNLNFSDSQYRILHHLSQGFRGPSANPPP
jgi:hypothetical protein